MIACTSSFYAKQESGGEHKEGVTDGTLGKQSLFPSFFVRRRRRGGPITWGTRAALCMQIVLYYTLHVIAAADVDAEIDS